MKRKTIEPCDDPLHPNNGASYHTGKACIEKGCGNPAGTAWGAFWCQPCNAKRLKRISAQLEVLAWQSVVKAVRPAGGVSVGGPEE